MNSYIKKTTILVIYIFCLGLSIEILSYLFLNSEYKFYVKDTLFYLKNDNTNELSDIHWWPKNKIKVRFEEQFFSTENIEHSVELIDCNDKINSNETNVFVVGGSAAFGFGIPNSKTFISILNNKCNDMNFINTARPGWSSMQMPPLTKRLLNNCKINYLLLLLGNNEFLNFNTQLMYSSNFNTKVMELFIQNSNLLSYIYYRNANRQAGIDKTKNSGFRAYKNLYNFQHYESTKTHSTEFLNKKKIKILDQFEQNMEKTILICLNNNITPILSSIPINLQLQPNWAFIQPCKLSKEEIHFLNLSIDKNKNLDEALDLIENYINLEEESSVYYYYKAKILSAMGDSENANHFFLYSRELMYGDLGSLLSVNSIIQSLSLKYDIPFIDLNKKFMEYISSKSKNKLFIDDCHYSPMGHEIIANKIESFFNAINNN
jgi:hypothetical protein